jgi:hypothetical protein
MGKDGPSTFTDQQLSAPADPALLYLLAEYISFLLQKVASWIPLYKTVGSNFDNNCTWTYYQVAVRGDVGGEGYLPHCF